MNATSPDLAVVLVHYRTPELLAPCLHALAVEAQRAGLCAETVVVDNGGLGTPDAALREALALQPTQVMTPLDNLGYAAGVHAGLAATRAPWVLALNPDVRLRAGCLSALWAAGHAGADVCGPRLEWDPAGRLWLPPTERRDFVSTVLARLALRGPRWQRQARARWRRHARRHWMAEAPLDSATLSGAALLFSREAWQRTGGFDPGYRLYFEETDWLLRCVRAGLRAQLVPAARAQHLYAQSAQREPRAAAWFADSERRFEQQHYAPLARALLSLATPRAGPSALPHVPIHATPPSIGLPAGECWVEWAPGLRGFPAAAERIQTDSAREWRLPSEVWEHLASGLYRVTSVDRHGRERDSVTLRRARQEHPRARSRGEAGT